MSRPLLLALLTTALAAADPVGATRVARWQDDRTAAFLLMFDDGWPSHWQVAVPVLGGRTVGRPVVLVHVVVACWPGCGYKLEWRHLPG